MGDREMAAVLREALANTKGWRQRARALLGVPDKREQGPRVSKSRYHVACACGADWEGRYAIMNTYIAAHRLREQAGQCDPDYQQPCKVTVLAWPEGEPQP